MWNEVAFFRAISPEQMVEAAIPDDGAEVYVWIGRRPDYRSSVDRRFNVTWVTYAGHEAHPKVWSKGPAEMWDEFSSVEDCLETCAVKNYSGFVIDNERHLCQFIRNDRKLSHWELRRLRLRKKDATLVVKVPYVVNEEEFVCYKNAEAYPGCDADYLLNFDSLYDCKLKCIEGNHGGFVTWHGHAYFRQKTPADLERYRYTQNQTELWIWKPRKPLPKPQKQRRHRRPKRDLFGRQVKTGEDFLKDLLLGPDHR